MNKEENVSFFGEVKLTVLLFYSIIGYDSVNMKLQTYI